MQPQLASAGGTRVERYIVSALVGLGRSHTNATFAIGIVRYAERHRTERPRFDGTHLRKEWVHACAACGLGRKIEIQVGSMMPAMKA